MIFNRLIVEKQVIYFVYRWEIRKFIHDFELICENSGGISMVLCWCQIFIWILYIDLMTLNCYGKNCVVFDVRP